ncbi:MAG: hypothetical protein KBD86_08750 [Candidatus Promineofilum sp.]|nr:hypothetical protein [Promineifilum sp.]
MQEVNSELTGRAGAELVTLEAAMAAAAVGAGKKGGKRRLAPAVMLGLLGASLLAACAPAVVEPQAGVATIQAAQSTEVQGGVVIASTEEPTEQPEVVEVMATEVPTETPEPTAEPTATPAPTETPTPEPTPTPEVTVAEGEVVFETTLGAEVIRAAVPEQVLPILAAGGTERGQVEEVDKAVWSVKEDAIYLGKVPVFVRSGEGWRYYEQVVYEENYINLGPALILPDVKSFENPELTEWPPAGVFVQNHSGFDTIDTAGQLAGGEISEVVLLRGGSTIETQLAYLEFKYKNPNTGRITSFWTTQHGSIWVDNAERSFSSLLGTRGAVVVSILTSRKSYPELRYKMLGTELGDIDIETLLSTILQGGVLPSTDAYISAAVNRY